VPNEFASNEFDLERPAAPGRPAPTQHNRSAQADVRAKRPKRPISNRRQIAGADRGTRDDVAACRALGRAPDAELAVVAQD
jgi:hypothetical protein